MKLAKQGTTYPKSKNEFIKFDNGIGNLACCDCGLVHKYKIIKKNNDYYIKAIRAERETLRLRSQNYGNLQKIKFKKNRYLLINSANLGVKTKK